ncbi:MAG: hypothetical protein CFE22_01935, partial [Cytophagaceae bacterium BCCC1]
CKGKNLFLIPKSLQEKNLFIYLNFIPILLLPVRLFAVWECKGKTLFPPFPNIILLFFLTLSPNSLLFKDF